MTTEQINNSEQKNSPNPIDGLADTVTRNVTNTYSKVFGDPSVARKNQEQQNKNSFEDTKNNVRFQNRSDENIGLAGTNKTIKNMTNMLNTITENLEEKDKNNDNQTQINLEKMVDFFKSEDENTNNENSRPDLSFSDKQQMTNTSAINTIPQANKEQNTSASNSNNTNPREEFHKKMYDTILKSATEKGLQNSDTIARLGAAQASYESGHGKKMPKDSNNAFGIKETRKDKSGSTVQTSETVDKKDVSKKQKFRKYDDVESSARDWLDIIQKDSRYKDVLESKDLNSAIDALGKSGYFTGNPEKYKKDITSIGEKYGKNLKPSESTQKAQQEQQKIDKPNIDQAAVNKSEQVTQVSRPEIKPETQSVMFTPGAENYGKVTLNPQGNPSAQKESTNDKPIQQPYMMQPPGSLPKDFNLQKMPATGMAIPEQMKPAPIAAEMQQQPQRQTGEQLSNMAEQQQTTRDEMSVSQAPVINNISSGGGGGGMQSVPQSSAANAPIASVRNEENAFVRMQNMMALQAMS
jgi:flagellum-specific peptidoglycan hydrolase FlgJ